MRGQRYHDHLFTEKNSAIIARIISRTTDCLDDLLRFKTSDGPLVDSCDHALEILGNIRPSVDSLLDCQNMPSPDVQVSCKASSKDDPALQQLSHHVRDSFSLYWKNMALSVGSQVLIHACTGTKPNYLRMANLELMKFSYIVHRQTKLAGSYNHHRIFLQQREQTRFTSNMLHEYAHGAMHYLGSPHFSTIGHTISALSVPPIVSEGFAECVSMEAGVSLGLEQMKQSLSNKRASLMLSLQGQEGSPYFHGAALMYLAIEKHGRSVLKEIARGKHEALLSD